MGDIAKSTHKSKWKESMFENYEQMNTAGTFSTPFLRKDLPPTIKILKAQPAFKVKLQDKANKYYLYIRTTANGSTLVQGIDFDASFAPTSFFVNIQFVLAIAAAETMSVFSLDVCNAFQTDIESNPPERVHISIPPFYVEYFFTKWPHHPLKGTPADKLCIHPLRSMQGSKDAGRK